MKAITLLSIALIAIFCSACDHNPTKNTESPKTETPEPLKDDYSAGSIKKVYSRGGSLMDDIYADLVKKRPELQNLETGLQQFYAGMPDSLEVFNKYAVKSGNYYDSANGALSDIKDTVLRARLRLLIASSNSKYMGKIKKFSTLMKDIDSNRMVINDYHLALKIAVTMPVIENYQDKNMPDSKSVESLASMAQKLKQQTVKLSKQ
jgi:hypothetical protein